MWGIWNDVKHGRRGGEADGRRTRGRRAKGSVELKTNVRGLQDRECEIIY